MPATRLAPGVFQKQMKVVGHQTKRIRMPARLLAGLCQRLQKQPPILAGAVGEQGAGMAGGFGRDAKNDPRDAGATSRVFDGVDDCEDSSGSWLTNGNALNVQKNKLLRY
jgi:hypothetical protein